MRSLEPEDFDNAIVILRQRGWHKGASVGPAGAISAERALNLAAHQRSGDWCDLEQAAKMLGLPAAKAIPAWNDAESTEFRNVVTRFMAAAREMRLVATTFVGTEAAAARIAQLKQRRK